MILWSNVNSIVSVVLVEKIMGGIIDSRRIRKWNKGGEFGI